LFCPKTAGNLTQLSTIARYVAQTNKNRIALNKIINLPA